MTRRIVLTMAIGVVAIAPQMAVTAHRGGFEDVDLTAYVNPFIGTDDGAPDYGRSEADLHARGRRPLSWRDRP